MSEERSTPDMVTLFPTLVSPFEKVRTSSLLLKVFQSTDERYPSVDDVA